MKNFMGKYLMVLILSFLVFSCKTLKQAPQLELREFDEVISGQIELREFAEIISSGDVVFTANGRGHASGMSITGNLINNTSNEIYINAVLRGGLYLHNSGKGQNMLALLILPAILPAGLEYTPDFLPMQTVQIKQADLEYNEIGKNHYFCLYPKTNIQITFVAFCANQERPTPKSDETFDIDSMPSEIVTIAKEISGYIADNFRIFVDNNFDSELVGPIQSALWGFQKGSISEKEFQEYIKKQYNQRLEQYRQKVRLLENFI